MELVRRIILPVPEAGGSLGDTVTRQAEFEVITVQFVHPEPGQSLQLAVGKRIDLDDGEIDSFRPLEPRMDSDAADRARDLPSITP